jgi:hypothetical protein
MDYGQQAKEVRLMTQDEIIEMARQAGLSNPLWIEKDYAIIEAFAKLVAAKEREACAAMLEDWSKHAWNPWDCAAAIRARGEA